MPLGITGTFSTGRGECLLPPISDVSNNEDCIGLAGLELTLVEVLEPAKLCSLCKVVRVSGFTEPAGLWELVDVDIFTVVETMDELEGNLFNWSARIKGGGAFINGGGTPLIDLVGEVLFSGLAEPMFLAGTRPCCSISF